MATALLVEVAEAVVPNTGAAARVATQRSEKRPRDRRERTETACDEAERRAAVRCWNRAKCGSDT